jgi:hypothetical protein
MASKKILSGTRPWNPTLGEERREWGSGQFLFTSPVSQNVPDEMSKEKQQQQPSDATNPEEKMLGQLGGIDLFLVHECRILPDIALRTTGE